MTTVLEDLKEINSIYSLDDICCIHAIKLKDFKEEDLSYAFRDSTMFSIPKERVKVKLTDNRPTNTVLYELEYLSGNKIVHGIVHKYL